MDMDEVHKDELEARSSRGDFIEDEEVTDLDDVEDEEEDSEEDESEDESEDGSEDDDISEDSEEEDEEDEEEGDEDEEVKDEPRIPKSRFDSVNQRMQKAEKRAEWLESQLEKLIESSTKVVEKKEEIPEYDFDAKEAEWVELVIVGDAEKAVRLRKEINNAIAEKTKREYEKQFETVNEIAKKESSTSILEDKFSELVNLYETEYPVLDSASEDYDEDITTTVNTLMSGYLANGKNKIEALRLAVKKIIPATKKSTPVRKKEAVKRNVRASKQQPNSGLPRGRQDRERKETVVSRLSEKDFASMSAREKAEARGDFYGR